MTTMREALLETSLPVERARAWLSTPKPAWYVEAIVGFGLWVGAALLVLFLVLSGLIGSWPFCVAVGIGSLVVAARLARVDLRTSLRAQLSFLLVVFGSSLVLIGIVEAWDSGRFIEPIGWGLIALGITIALAIRGVATRFAAVVAIGVGAGLLGDRGPAGAMELLVGLWAAVTTALWLARPRLLGTAWTQLARVAAFASPLLAVGMWSMTARVHVRGAPVEATAFAEGVVVVVLALCGAATVWIAQREQRAPRLALVVGLVAVVGMTVAGWQAPLALLGVLYCALAVVRRDIVLQGVGVVVMLGGVGFMLWVDGSLSRGALICFGLGTTILVARAALLFIVGDEGEPVAPMVEGSVRSPVGVRPARLTRAGLALAASVVGSVAVVGALMVQREALIARGTPVLLELAPVDPRSILQGDFMILRYAASAQVSRTGPAEGVAIFRVDNDGVGRFVREGDARPVAGDEVKVRFRRRDGEVVFGAETFLFEEGQGAHFARARHAELRVDVDGRFLVVDLRDADRASLGGARR